MSSVDCYMLVSSGLLIRNVYVPFFNPKASDDQCLALARITGAAVILGAIVFSWSMMDVFKQLQLTWVVPMLFAAPFWAGMYWRRATTTAAWITIGFTATVFFLIPWILPIALPGLKSHPRFTQSTHLITSTTSRESAPADLRRRQAEINAWDAAAAAIAAQKANKPEEQNKALSALGNRPKPIRLGELITEVTTRGGQAIYWSDGVFPKDKLQLREVSRETQGNTEILIQAYDGPMIGRGNFNLDFLIYDLLGVPMQRQPDSMLATMELPPKIIAPFLVMILCSLLTRPNGRNALDRYYAKMKTPVRPNPEADQKALAFALRHPEKLESQKLFPGSNFEFSRPKAGDVIGFLTTFALCFLIIAFAIWIANLG